MKTPQFLPSAIAVAIAIQIAPWAPAAHAQLEEVIVTAQKRSERLSDVPIAITNFGAESIAQTGVREVKEVAQYVPNLTISSGSDFNTAVTMRGVGSNSRNIGFDTRVGVYLDGVYLGQSPAINQDLLDLERIEVLRGPQGTLFGKNTVAGAMNLISQKPTDTLEGSIGMEYGSLDSRQVSGTVNVPLGDSVAVKVSANQQQREGDMLNLTTGHLLNEQDASAYRAQLQYDAGGAFTAIATVDGMSSDRLSTSGEPVTNTFGSAPERAAPEPREVALDLDPSEQRDIEGASLTLEWDLESGFSLKSITASRSTELEYRNDVDYSPLNLVKLDYQDAYDQFTQEFQLVSPDDGGFRYVAGLYFYDQDADSTRVVTSSALFEAALEQQFGAPGLVDPSKPVFTDGSVETRSYAAYFNGAYPFAENWELGFGLRYSEEEKDVDWRIDGSGAPLFRIASGAVQDSRTDSHLSPTVSLTYSLTDDINAYARYSSGFKSGGYNLDFVTAGDLAAGIDFDKETVDAYEIGLKGTAMERRLSFGVALFHSAYEDYQVNQFVDLGNGSTSISIRNAAEVDTTGLEVELTYMMSERFTVDASLGLLDAEFGSYPNADSNGNDLTGNRLPSAPEVSFNLGGQYYLPVDALDADVLFRLDYVYRDDFYNTAENEQSRTLATGDVVQYGWVDDYQLINARIGLLSRADTWSISLYGQNLADEEYLTETRRDFLGTLRHFHGLERTVGVELEYRF